jgi:tetratricopeptide (TPR) repeat protein
MAAALLLAAAGSLFAQDKEDALELYRSGQFEKAIAVCQKELASYPEDAVSRRLDSYSVIGWSYLKLKRYNDAITTCREAQKYSQYDYRITEIMAEAYFYTGNPLESLKYFQKYTVLNPVGERLKTAYYYMGEIFIQLGEYNHADISFSTALYYAPSVAKWWARLGYAREMAGEKEGAVAAYQKALSLSPGLQDAEKGLERVKTAQ